MSIKWWNENKMWLAPIAALIMWAVSVLCFVFGLSFKNPMGVLVGNTDISILIAFALSVANTIIQLIGNGQDFEKMDGVFRIGWYSSYVLGIASNVNALIGILGINNAVLEWAVALSLGSMIEIMPEKLIVVWLRTMPEKKKEQSQQNNNPSVKKNIPYKPQHKPTLGPVQTPVMPSSYSEPAYHPIGMKPSNSFPKGQTYLQSSHDGEE